MLDVHPPHSPTHTWKDFFLHIATITVGLLIAVGLEQTVELFHHRHQRHQLEEELRTETLHNMQLALRNIDSYAEQQRVVIAQYTEVEAAAHQHRAPQLVSRPVMTSAKPAYAVWVVAQQNATLGLLPGAESQRYVRVYSIADQVSACFLDENAARGRLNTALWPARIFDPAQPQGSPSAAYDLSRMTSDQMGLFRESLAALGTSQSYCINRSRLLYGIAWAAWHNYTSDDETLRVAIEASNMAGGKAAMLARYPLPEEAKHPTTADGDR